MDSDFIMWEDNLCQLDVSFSTHVKQIYFWEYTLISLNTKKQAKKIENQNWKVIW